MIGKSVDAFVRYAQKRLCLDERNILWVKNRIATLIGAENVSGDGTQEFTSIEEAVQPLIEYALKKGKIDKKGEQWLMCALADTVMLSPSEFDRKFKEFESNEQAMEWVATYSENCGYIKAKDIKKNIVWKAENTKGKIVVTINTAKPEKDNKLTEKLLRDKTERYPLCDICRENEGFSKKGFYKQNLRTVSLNLGGEAWFWQFSPYAYFDRHGIAINCKHTPMKVDGKAVEKLLDFVEMFPFYFIGCNAALPRVGGSILAHEHFQGGKEDMPIFDAPIEIIKRDVVNIGKVDWYNNVLYLESKDKKEIGKVGAKIIEFYDDYRDESVGLIPFSGSEKHNAVSVTARKKGSSYVLYLILRNNRVSEKFPYGIFHAYEQFHNIKKESIGLIEAMGRFILPGRLKDELNGVREVLIDKRSLENLSENLIKHTDMIKVIGKKKIENCGDANLEIKRYVESVCEEILKNTAIFKEDDKGRVAYNSFLKRVTEL